jgi:ribosomal protein L11 methyltransferase
MKSSPLIQISLAIPSAAEEPISALFENVLGQTPSIYTDERTKRTTATVYLEHFSDETRAQLAQKIKELKQCGIELGSAKIKAQEIAREDWAESWKKHFKPIEIGNALLIKPSWSKRRVRKNQALVVLDPGLSFGTGQHATTSFCLEQIVGCRKKNLSQSFLDIGTGSGILAIAAAKLGYAPVEAFDFDPEAVRVSIENAEQNGVSNLVRPTQQDLTKLPKKAKTQFDLVCANLIYDLLIAESERILNRVKPDGNLVLAGILKTQFGKVKKHFQSFGWKLAATRIEKEWQSGRFIRKK